MASFGEVAVEDKEGEHLQVEEDKKVDLDSGEVVVGEDFVESGVEDIVDSFAQQIRE